MPRWSVVWITGASTGIGRELALRLAAQGSRVAVSARSVDKLEDLARLSPAITVFPLDVTDAAAVAATVDAIERQLGAIDLAVLNAGVWDPMTAVDYSADRAAASMKTNYLGVANGVDAIVPRFMARRSGHLALVASVVGYRGLPQTAAYAPTKAAVISLAEVLQPDLARHGIMVSLINPGFVDTPMTAVNTFPMPFLMSPSAAVDRIVAGLARKRFEITFPWPLVAMLKVMRLLPYPLYFWIVRTFMAARKRD